MSSTTVQFKEVPRSLSQVEIEDIVGIVPKVQAASERVAAHNHEQIVETLRLQLREVKLKPSKIPELKARIFNRCRRAEIQPGETVGLHAAEAIGQPITQATLDTFHKSGDAIAGNIGVHVFAELLNLTQNRKMSTANIHLNDWELSTTDAINVSRAFIAVSVKSLLEDPLSSMMFIESSKVATPETRPRFYEMYEKFYSTKCPSPETVPVFLRLTLDPSRLFASRITTFEVAKAIEEAGGVICVFSPTFQGIIDIYPNPNSILKYITKQEKKAQAQDVAQKKSRKKSVKVSAPSDELAGEALGSGLTPENAAFIFLQMFICPRIMNETLVVGSKHSYDSLVYALSKRTGKKSHVPPQASSLALFKSVSFLTSKVTDIVRGATLAEAATAQNPVARWNFWIDRQKEMTISVPREKLVDLIRKVFGKDSIVSVSETVIVFDVPTRVFSGGNPLDHLNKTLMEAKKISDEETKKQIDENPLGKIPEKSDLEKIGFYTFLKGVGAIAPSLRRLVIHPAINQMSTITNNPHEIAAVRGIEAARGAIFKELHDLVVATGSTINSRHVQIIVDVMVSSGTLMPFTARGSVRQQLGAYSESSFEQALQAFLRSAVSGAPEPVSATSTSILVGKKCEFGTGAFLVLSDNPPNATAPPSNAIPLASTSKYVAGGGSLDALSQGNVSTTISKDAGVSANEVVALVNSTEPATIPALETSLNAVPSSSLGIVSESLTVKHTKRTFPDVSSKGFGSLSFPPEPLNSVDAIMNAFRNARVLSSKIPSQDSFPPVGW